ncbi:g-type lectin s-receptor-like serine/threonine-protein kinase ces101 [Quercus suber]|uniref:G-type lectin s-receptor-like serine/threonine-protein kinase ces101 n=1 Tax=Quercus suber TaxID=58331 RepID=A0AAW0M9D1_QUESU
MESLRIRCIVSSSRIKMVKQGHIDRTNFEACARKRMTIRNPCKRSNIVRCTTETKKRPCSLRQGMYSNGSTKWVLWQSFDHLALVLIPEMKLGVNHKTGQNWSLTSWLTWNVPNPGAFTLE